MASPGLGGALFISVLVGTVGFCMTASAQELMQNTTIASPVTVIGDVADGDIVSYDVSRSVYRVSDTYEDESMFGVVVVDPVLYMGEAEPVAGTWPVIRYGEATVNVSTLGGEIQAGDLITTSSVPGRGQRAERESVSYILGFALEPMVVDASLQSVQVSGEEIVFGTVPVALRIGPHVPGDLDDAIASSTAALMGSAEKKEKGGFDTFKAFRYLLAAIVATGSILIALRRFGDMFSQSVISVGRNPLAKSQIHSLMFWNGLVIFLISGIGLSVSAALILVP